MAEGGCRIAVLDDDPVFVEVLARSLRRRGHAVQAANDLATLLRVTSEQAPDYAIVDLKIAEESGLDCIAPLLARNPAMRILILTGYASVATAVTAIKAGAFDYACKPLDADEILHKLAIAGQPAAPAPAEDDAQPLSVRRLAWEHIQRVLLENGGNVSATARSLGMHRRTLQRMLQKRPVRQ
jgi:two-component system response regulator RegA